MPSSLNPFSSKTVTIVINRSKIKILYRFEACNGDKTRRDENNP